MTSEDIGPGTARPGGRTARVRSAVLRAAGDALAEHGLAGLDLADVARRAEVGKTTVYRRWGTPATLVADLLADMAEQSLPRTESGTLLGDLRANARLVARTLADPHQGALFKAVIAAATCDTRTAAALHRFYDIRVSEWEPCARQAVERGELPADTDTREVIRAVSAPLYYRLLTTGEPLDEATADRAAEAAAAAARAGAFRTARP
ncbi:putative TetR-family transcriptional regulator [Streptomyces ambofaciens ATCC 23877]|uniref:Putative TetR-family transcriptional regulator n=1 Tax=Streptomyces ambofaciens (strain ATCC 23877 / 3486 / DSM 40053 / JCM 4204 / NBRC 12836 / NRRL B-2516) TaxID=278992 RepID=A0ACU9_STRA7|nr:TetR/AcrR family transcriptional regulator [Streptomyces ambofaciens]AKZ60036.1 putative TetR-family transcriptional regulator [Streptomyces ambofaciens ATCC 23877]CAJ88304.1 putative TetR-family transcriptional regulator [Streptomyces ambofaciens ATCC 23877]